MGKLSDWTGHLKVYLWHLLQAGAGTMRPVIISSLSAASLGGGGHTNWSI